MDTQFFIADSVDVGLRLDIFCSNNCELTRSRIKNLIDGGLILVNNKETKSGYSLKKDDQILINIPDIIECSAAPQDIPIDIVYEDDDIAVVNKPQGMVTHPSIGSPDKTLVNALLYHLKSLSDINGVIRPGIVHRLDKDTSGLLVIAKNNEAHICLAKQIADKTAHRIYRAIVDGNVKEDEGIIDQPIGRSNKDRKKMAVVTDGRAAITHYRVLERFGQYTYMEYELKTGRTHQIRVHSQFIKHPIIGDSVYGGSNKFDLKGQLLHAYQLILIHPRTNELMNFSAPLPVYFKAVLSKLNSNHIDF